LTRRTRTSCAVLLLLGGAAGLVAPAAGAANGILTGFLDPGSFQQSSQSGRLGALAAARGVGASVVRLQRSWSSIQPARPPDLATAADPSWPGYDWSQSDAEVRDVVAGGLIPLLSFASAPPWAERAPRPRVSYRAPEGTWRPSPEDYAAFATAVARRYSGAFPDPALPGATLPRVRYWQAWNEPNLSTYLTPQWIRRGGRDVPASPSHYRRLLNAFYGAVKAVAPDNVVLTAGTAPYGDPGTGGRRMMPVRFTRELLCLGGPSLRRLPCPDPAHFDVLAHHPYGVGAPRRKALNADDVAVPDIHKLTRVVRVAASSGRLLPAGPKPTWVTEMSWDSSPPDPNGVPVVEHARWLEEGFYVLWRQGVSVVTWLLLRDAPPVPSYPTTYQSGPFFRNGSPKPAARAFRFPFVTERTRDGRLVAWGKAPAPGPLTIERRAGRAWVIVRHVEVGSSLVFTTRLRVGVPARLRARQGQDVTLTWPQR
jgi:hypothetical protein